MIHWVWVGWIAFAAFVFGFILAARIALAYKRLANEFRDLTEAYAKKASEALVLLRHAAHWADLYARIHDDGVATDDAYKAASFIERWEDKQK